MRKKTESRVAFFALLMLSISSVRLYAQDDCLYPCHECSLDTSEEDVHFVSQELVSVAYGLEDYVETYAPKRDLAALRLQTTLFSRRARTFRRRLDRHIWNGYELQSQLRRLSMRFYDLERVARSTDWFDVQELSQVGTLVSELRYHYAPPSNAIPGRITSAFRYR